MGLRLRASTGDRQTVGGARRPTGGRSTKAAGGPRGATGSGRAMAGAATNGEAAGNAAGSCARGPAIRGAIRACDAADMVRTQLQAARQAVWRERSVGRGVAHRRSREPGASQQQKVAALEQIRPSQRHSVMLAESMPGATNSASRERTTDRRRRLMVPAIIPPLWRGPRIPERTTGVCSSLRAAVPAASMSCWTIFALQGTQ